MEPHKVVSVLVVPHKVVFVLVVPQKVFFVIVVPHKVVSVLVLYFLRKENNITIMEVPYILDP